MQRTQCTSCSDNKFEYGCTQIQVTIPLKFRKICHDLFYFILNQSKKINFTSQKIFYVITSVRRNGEWSIFQIPPIAIPLNRLESFTHFLECPLTRIYYIPANINLVLLSLSRVLLFSSKNFNDTAKYQQTSKFNIISLELSLYN